MTSGRGWRLRQLLGALFGFSGLIVAAAALAGGLAFDHLTHQRDNLVNRIDPASSLSSQLLADYVDQETGVRGYDLSGQALFLGPYDSGRVAAGDTARRLAGLLPPGSPAGHLLAVVEQRAARWTSEFAVPAIASVSGGRLPVQPSDVSLEQGRNLFDSLRSSIADLQADLAREHQVAQASVVAASDQLLTVMVVALAVIVADGLLVWLSLRRLVVRPLAEVSADTRSVTEGQLTHEVRRAGPAEIAELASDIEAMRRRIFAEVEQVRQAREELEATNTELVRSNEDLERFAYVASHDLQEPLRKVASFCQLLEQRYGGQLDERGEQYIAFAVDGAKRMQNLITDLLAFSRIGRTTEKFVKIDMDDCLDQAVRNLAASIEATEASVRAEGPLPRVDGDRSLLVALLQNLIGNAVKFHGDQPPSVLVGCRPSPDEAQVFLWSVEDHGIGIESRFAERVFVIFQRLHGRDAYPGTGIGLALCRKIVEFHGGRIWLDTDFTGGTRFCFTLPMPPNEEVKDVRHADQSADSP